MAHWGKSKLAQKAQGQLCASASVPGGLGQEVIQLAVGGLMEGNQVYLSFPKSINCTCLNSSPVLKTPVHTQPIGLQPLHYGQDQRAV